MKVLRLAAYCYPERVSSSHLNNDLYDAFEQHGLEMEIYAPIPTRGIDDETRNKYKYIKYEELNNGAIKIHRFNLMSESKKTVFRAFRYLVMSIKQYRCGIKAKDVDLVYTASTPPTQGLLSAIVAKRLSKKYKRKVPFVYNLQDVFPDSLVTTGLTKKSSIIYKIGDKIANYAYRNADKIIVISEDMKKNLVDKGVPEDKLSVIYNWVDTKTVRPINKKDNKLYDELGLSSDTFKVVYAGNLGKAQGLDTALDAARLLVDNKNIEFLIFGQGVEEERLKKKAQDLPNVKFYPLMPQSRVSEVYSLGDACLVLCNKGTGGAGVPSKTWSIMACGSPLLISFDENSELCRIVERAKAGVCVPPEESDSLSKCIINISIDAQSRRIMSENARNYVIEFASKINSTNSYVKLISEIIYKESVNK